MVPEARKPRFQAPDAWHGRCRTSHAAYRTTHREKDDMKLITAIIKPFKLDDVRAALSEIGRAHV